MLNATFSVIFKHCVDMWYYHLLGKVSFNIRATANPFFSTFMGGWLSLLFLGWDLALNTLGQKLIFHPKIQIHLIRTWIFNGKTQKIHGFSIWIFGAKPKKVKVKNFNIDFWRLNSNFQLIFECILAPKFKYFEASKVYILRGQKMIKIAKMVDYGEFLKTWSLRSNSVTRQVNFNRTKIEKFKCNILSDFQTRWLLYDHPIFLCIILV